MAHDICLLQKDQRCFSLPIDLNHQSIFQPTAVTEIGPCQSYFDDFPIPHPLGVGP
jgi:hypothetical protein